MQQAPPQGAQDPSAQQSAPQGGGQGAAEQAIMMIQKGFGVLAKMIQSAGQNVDPQDAKLFQQAVMATDNFVQSISGSEGGEEEAPAKPAPGGPMPANANANAKPAPQY